jgi:hypothetical protein
VRTFAPDRNTANATYTPAWREIGTTITLTWNVPDPDGTGPCTAATDQMNITINTATVASAGADQTTCGASPITLAANATTGGNWTGGAGTFELRIEILLMLLILLLAEKLEQQ